MQNFDGFNDRLDTCCSVIRRVFKKKIEYAVKVGFDLS